MRITISVSLVGWLLSLSACQNLSETAAAAAGINDDQLNRLGHQAFAELKTTVPISNNKKLTAYVNCVADAITAQVTSEQYNGSWEVVVFESQQLNAFALPGGKIGVYSGILKVAKTQGQLAAILGHEVAHVTLKHAKQRMTVGAAANAALAVSNSSLGNLPEKTRGLVMGSLGVGVNYGVSLPFSRKNESQADIAGHRLMAKAGFNPIEAVNLWKNMSATKGGSMPQILSSHPSDQTRINGLMQSSASVMADYKNSKNKPSCRR